VSNLVRNVLEEVFTAVENVSEDVGGFFEDVIDEAEGVRERVRKQQRSARRQRRDARRSRPGSKSSPAEVEDELREDEAAEANGATSTAPPADRAASKDASDILGWQPMVLNRIVNCTICETEIVQGGNAFMAISQSGALGKIVCPSCTRS
jgi:hypothetical protein